MKTIENTLPGDGQNDRLAQNCAIRASLQAEMARSLRALLGDPLLFAEYGTGIRLRAYQQQVATAILDSVFQHKGLTFVIMFPRQSGKNELQAQIEAYLLILLSQSSAEIVKVSPTWKPQSLNAMRRLERVLSKNLVTRNLWSKESGYVFKIGTARIFFLSGAPEANIVGATASTLLEVDEAQDVQPAKFDKDIAPMAASTNATRVFWGTAWTSNTLLARELRAAQSAECQDGLRRVFRIDADTVAAEVPAYGKFVAGQIDRLGRSSAMVRTQFFSEELDAGGALFTPARLALMQGSHGVALAPTAGAIYVFLLDVAGVDEAAQNLDAQAAGLSNPRRDSTALTIAEVDLCTCEDPIISAPTYRVVSRHMWTGVSQSEQYARLVSLAATWAPRRLVVDATGVGAGLAGFLEKALPGRVTPFVFSQASKSRLGWDFLALVDAGRWKEPLCTAESSSEGDRLHALFLSQLALVSFDVLPGPGRMLRWSVPDGTRDPATGEIVHDDLVLSAALVAAIDALPWAAPGPALVISRPDPIQEYDHGF